MAQHENFHWDIKYCKVMLSERLDENDLGVGKDTKSMANTKVKQQETVLPDLTFRIHDENLAHGNVADEIVDTLTENSGTIANEIAKRAEIHELWSDEEAVKKKPSKRPGINQLSSDDESDIQPARRQPPRCVKSRPPPSSTPRNTDKWVKISEQAELLITPEIAEILGRKQPAKSGINIVKLTAKEKELVKKIYQ